ncbi:ATP-binding cassette sub-family G member 1-like [Adelges cooleyi]|uniref:ATP-binding cassette sub-family G member 1-like n=1 Tax=Adelges cooleyi TaxID=133065 RepID=UPI00218056BC|nr:ATP-binding cassette sub-family G member 1-like [Adelges cooleyi]
MAKPLLSRHILNVEFKDLTYEVNTWTEDLKFNKKTVLNGINGAFSYGQFCAIIGCSGCGKSSLLNILSGYNANNYSGTILINNKLRDIKLFKKQSCYIMQEDHLYNEFTINEAMEFAMKLKNSVLMLDSRKLKMIDDILNNLHLDSQRNTFTAKLSGGERRKLSVALELIHNPSMMFFDEPTTGLDSLSANKVVSMLKDLSTSGRTIVCTIHQASALQLEMFDVLYVLSPTGHCIYHGLTSDLTDFLAEQGLQCPLFHNIADFIIEVSLGEHGDHVYNMIKSIENGKQPKLINNTDQSKYVGEIQLPDEKYKITKQNRHCLIQLITLLHRSVKKMSREKFLSTRLLVHILVGSLYAWIYFRIGDNASFIHDNLMLLFFSLMFIMYTASSTMIISFPLEFQVLAKEHFNQWYSLTTYYISNTIVDLPVQMLCTFLYCVVVYYFTGQPPEFLRFTFFTLIVLMVGLLSQAIGMLMGTLFDDLKFSTVFTSFLLMPWMMFGGVFIKISDTPLLFRWMFDISFMKHAMEAILHCVYGSNRAKLHCPKMYCYNTIPSKVLNDLDMPVNIYWYNMAALTTIYLIMKMLVYQVLKKKLN